MKSSTNVRIALINPHTIKYAIFPKRNNKPPHNRVRQNFWGTKFSMFSKEIFLNPVLKIFLNPVPEITFSESIPRSLLLRGGGLLLQFKHYMKAVDSHA